MKVTKPTTAPTAKTVKKSYIDVLSFNILFDSFSLFSSYPSWEERKCDVATILRQSKAEIIGIQEATFNQIKFLKSQLDDYVVIFFKKVTDSTLLYDNRTFKEVDRGYWPLSAGSGSTSFFTFKLGNVMPRNVVWALLEHRKYGYKLYALSTHFDNKFTSPMTEITIKNMKKALKPNIPIVFAGDFNIGPQFRASSFEALKKQTGLQDSYETIFAKEIKEGKKPIRTYLVADRQIDHIFYSGSNLVNIVAVDWKVINFDKVKASDHYPIWARLEITNRKK